MKDDLIDFLFVTAISGVVMLLGLIGAVVIALIYAIALGAPIVAVIWTILWGMHHL